MLIIKNNKCRLLIDSYKIRIYERYQDLKSMNDNKSWFYFCLVIITKRIIIINIIPIKL